jgi:hypothetical protein
MQASSVHYNTFFALLKVLRSVAAVIWLNTAVFCWVCALKLTCHLTSPVMGQDLHSLDVLPLLICMQVL